MATIDRKGAYFHVSVHHEFRGNSFLGEFLCTSVSVLRYPLENSLALWVNHLILTQSILHLGLRLDFVCMTVRLTPVHSASKQMCGER